MGVKRTAAQVQDASGEYAPQAVKPTVPEGYKQSEVGVIPEDWNVWTLGQTSRGIYRGASPRPIGDSRWFDEHSEIGWVRISDVTRSNRYLLSTTQKLSDEGTRRSRFIPRGSLIMSICATVGRPIETAVDACIHDGFVVFEKPEIDQGFLYHILCDLEPRWSDKGQTGSQMNLNTNLIRNTEIPVPPTEEEQRAIATALSDVDALLEGLDRLIAKKRDLKQAAMQQLLTGQTRLPGFEGEWETKRLGELLTICHGRSQSEVETRDGPYPILATSGQIGTAKRPLYSEPSVLIGRKGTINKPQYMAEPFWTVDTLFYSVIEGDNDAKYFYYRFLMIDWMQYNEASGVPSLNARTIESIEIKCPKPPEQSAIATVLSDMDAEIEALEQRRTTTAALKQAMMQELLTGKTRLVEPEVSGVQVEAASSNAAKGHNWAINEAVVIAVLVKHFGKEDYPLGRKRYTKLSYLLHRRVEQQAEGYLKKAAGPYNPQTKYGGPEKIAKENGYIKQHKGPKGHSGFIVADNIAQAEGYFEKWYGTEVLQWLEQFCFKTNDDLEVLATVDMAAVELRASGKSVDAAAVKDVIASHPEWEAKLDRPAFSDANIAEAIKQNDALLDPEIAGGTLA